MSGPRPVLSQNLLPFLERKIIRRELPPGLKLREEELCQRYAVSRSPLREALRLLEGTGLVVRTPRRGVAVAPMTARDLDQVFACRVPLEGLAARGAAGSPAATAVADALTDALAAMGRALEIGDVERCFDANAALTEVLHAGAGNPTLLRLLAQVEKPALRYRHFAYARAPELIAISIGANRQMIEAIRAHDPDRAAAVTEDLVRRAWDLLRPVVARDPAFAEAEGRPG